MGWWPAVETKRLVTMANVRSHPPTALSAASWPARAGCGAKPSADLMQGRRINAVAEDEPHFMKRPLIPVHEEGF